MKLKSKVLLGLKWTTFATICTAAVAILKISILARYLDKSDFGLMALVSFVIGFVGLFGEGGLSTAILHKQNVSKKVYSSLYWFNILFSILLYVVLFFLAPAIANLYNESELSHLIPLLGLNLIISGVGLQFKTLEIKNMHFKHIGIIDIFSALISLLFSVWLAINGFGVLSLIYSLLVQNIISNFLFFIIGIRKYGLRLHFKIHEVLPFLRIGVFQVAGQSANYFNRDLDILLIGKFFSTEVLGGYSLAKQLVFRPLQLINPILVKVASPTLVKFQDDIKVLKKNYLKLVSIVSSINLYAYISIILFAPLIVKILYGSEFGNIVILVRILSVYMIFRAIGNPIGSLVVATGRTDLEFYWNMLNLLIMPLFIYFGASYGIEQVAYSLVLAVFILFVPSWRLLTFKMTRASFKEYLTAIFISFTKDGFKKILR